MRALFYFFLQIWKFSEVGLRSSGLEEEPRVRLDKCDG